MVAFRSSSVAQQGMTQNGVLPQDIPGFKVLREGNSSTVVHSLGTKAAPRSRSSTVEYQYPTACGTCWCLPLADFLSSRKVSVGKRGQQQTFLQPHNTFLCLTETVIVLTPCDWRDNSASNKSYKSNKIVRNRSIGRDLLSGRKPSPARKINSILVPSKYVRT